MVRGPTFASRHTLQPTCATVTWRVPIFRSPFAALQAPALWPEHANPDPKDPIPILEAGVGVGAQDDVELMAKEQVLKSQVASRSEQGDEAAEEQFEHPAGYPLGACSTLNFVLDGLLPPYSWAAFTMPTPVRPEPGWAFCRPAGRGNPSSSGSPTTWQPRQ
jgi:hypothetical protein